MLLIQRGKEERLISQLITLLALPRHKHSRWDSIKSPSLVHWLSSAARSIALPASGSPVFSVVGSRCMIALSAPGLNLLLFSCSAYYFSLVICPLFDCSLLQPSLSLPPFSLSLSSVAFDLLARNPFLLFPPSPLSISLHFVFPPTIARIRHPSVYNRKHTVIINISKRANEAD